MKSKINGHLKSVNSILGFEAHLNRMGTTVVTALWKTQEHGMQWHCKFRRLYYNEECVASQRIWPAKGRDLRREWGCLSRTAVQISIERHLQLGSDTLPELCLASSTVELFWNVFDKLSFWRKQVTNRNAWVYVRFMQHQRLRNFYLFHIHFLKLGHWCILEFNYPN